MKTKLFFVLILIYSVVTSDVYSQCSFPSAWTKNLTSRSYTYTFDWSNLTLGMFPQETNLSTVESNIRSNVGSALSSWGGASGISFSYVGNYQSADLTVSFADLGGKAGDASYSPLGLTFDTSVGFSFSQSSYFIFITVALHEAGRLFHGTDHPNYDDSNSATIETYPGRYISSISSCDQYAMNTLYYYTASYNNEFESGLTGGSMNVNGTVTTLPSTGSSTLWHKNDPTKYLVAIDQQAGSYFRLFKYWNDNEFGTRSIDLQKFTRSYLSQFVKQFNITFDGSVTINYQTYAANDVYHARQYSPFSAYANPKVESSLYEILSSWKQGSNVLGYDNPHSFSPTDNTSYSITYTVQKPTNDYRGLTINTTVGDPVYLSWNEHPSSDVTEYRIFRKVRPSGGTTGAEVQIGTVSRGTTTFTDYDYVISNLFYYQLYYDVRAYYQPNGSTTDPSFISTFGQIAPSFNDNQKQIAFSKQEIPSEYSLTNYPNPFNPTTTINYQLPENGFVAIKVYDVLGKEVATLVNENKSAGYYKVDFDASRLTSGVYIYTINVNGFAQSKKMLLMK